ncbi:hypothetical protein TNCV_2740711 [Trichonephila clavipes]|nr:hypothetical protein TNCV_2740711 [Trichonephila clavipes]
MWHLPLCKPSRRASCQISHKIIESIHKIITEKRSCLLQWIPVHVNIFGKEKTDELAKESRAFPNRLASRPSSTPMHLPDED